MPEVFLQLHTLLLALSNIPISASETPYAGSERILLHHRGFWLHANLLSSIDLRPSAPGKAGTDSCKKLICCNTVAGVQTKNKPYSC